MMEVHATLQFKNAPLYRAVQKCGSQQALAEYLGVSPMTISRWLNFKQTPNYKDTRRKDHRKTYDRWEKLLLNLVGYGLETIFPEELLVNQLAIRDAARKEAFFEMPVETLIAAGAVKHLSPAPDKALEQKELTQVISRHLDDLSPREKFVITLRFGLNKDGEHTLEDVAQEVGVTRERIRQIEAKALRKLRNPQHTKELKGFYIDTLMK